MEQINGYSKLITNYYSIKKYNDNLYKFTFHKFPIKNSGFEVLNNIKREYSRDVNDEKLDNHISRAKNKIFEYAVANEFDYFLTLTLDKDKYNRYDLGKYIKDLGQMIRDYRKKTGANIQYLLIPEPHKNGAWHMHGLIKGIPQEDLTKNKNGYLDWSPYSKKFGYCSIDPVRSQEAISKYITKYISKALQADLKREKEKKLYYVTRGLKTAIKVKEGTLNGELNAPFDYENDYIKTKMLNGLEYLRLDNQL